MQAELTRGSVFALTSMITFSQRLKNSVCIHPPVVTRSDTQSRELVALLHHVVSEPLG